MHNRARKLQIANLKLAHVTAPIGQYARCDRCWHRRSKVQSLLVTDATLARVCSLGRYAALSCTQALRIFNKVSRILHSSLQMSWKPHTHQIDETVLTFGFTYTCLGFAKWLPNHEKPSTIWLEEGFYLHIKLCICFLALQIMSTLSMLLLHISSACFMYICLPLQLSVTPLWFPSLTRCI